MTPLLKAAIAIQGASTLMQGAAGYQQGQYNAKVYEQQAEETRLAAQVNERNQRRAAEKALASQRASLLASGIQMNGSPLEVLIDLAHEYDVDKSIRLNNAAAEQARLRSQASMSRLMGRNALTTSLLTAAGQGFMNYSLLNTPKE